MPDLLDENGLQVATSEEIQTDLENGYKSIYSDDIAIGSNTQDGQLIAIYTQMATDYEYHNLSDNQSVVVRKYLDKDADIGTAK